MSAGRVLIADDDEDFRGLLVRRAQRMGLQIVEAKDGTQAIEALQDQTFDVLVVDLYMPGASGLDVVDRAHQNDPDTQTIILTGSASVETAVEALRAGVYDYMTKPLESLAAFEMSLSRALDHRQLIHDNARLFAEVQRLALTDPLTGLYNRRKLGEALDFEVERAARYRRPLSIIMLDIDNMKVINDVHGHPAGDEVLRKVAQAIRSQVRKVDLAARYGGDEFLILLPEAALMEAKAIAERILGEVSRKSFPGVSVSASAGVVQWAPECASVQEFLRQVDSALYADKRARYPNTGPGLAGAGLAT